MSPGALAAASAAVLLSLSCAGPAAWAQHVHEPPPGAAPPRSRSIYEISAALVDQRGQPAGLDVFRGHPVLIGMFYASCRDTCFLLIAEIQRIEMELPPGARANLRVVLVSFDPERDTPAVLQALARARGVDESRWRFLRAPEDSVREIAAVLGIKYRRLPDGNFSHTSLITLLDTSGVAQARVEGIGQPHADLLRRLRAMAPSHDR